MSNNVKSNNNSFLTDSSKLTKMKSGDFIKRLRKDKGISQSKLADIVNVSERHIQDLEAGKGTKLFVYMSILKHFDYQLVASPIENKESFIIK